MSGVIRFRGRTLAIGSDRRGILRLFRARLPGLTLCGVPTPKSYLLLQHIAKSGNLAALLRSADSFGVHEVVVVGRRQLPTGPAVGMGGFVRRAWFARLGEARDYLAERGCRILGSEVDAAAPPIEAHPFVGDTAFVVGNEGDGLTVAQRAICDGFVRIRQYGHAPSLNVNVAGAIVLHHFALWAGFAERPIDGEKFVPAAFEPPE